MKTSVFVFAMLILPLFSLSAEGTNDTRIETVHFAKGASSQLLKGTLKGWSMVEYRLNAKAGQLMEVTLHSSNEANFFNVMAPGADSAIFIGADRGKHFKSRLPDDGTYKILVYLMRNEARRGMRAKYRMTVTITD